MLRLLICIACVLGLSTLRPVWAAAAEPLVLGIFPNLSARQIVETYRPLADALEKSLQRRVTVYSARDFKTFIARTRAGEYDILLTAPHLAWLARQDAGYRPLLKYSQQVHGLLVVRSRSPFEDIAALRGRTFASADPLALAVLAMQDELAARGLKPGIDYRISEAGSHANALMLLVNGQLDAALVGVHPYNQASPEIKHQTRILARTKPLSSLMYLAHPRLGDREARAVSDALRAFAATPAGKDFLQRGGFGSLVETDGNELQSFHAYALRVQDLLREQAE